MHGLHAQTAAKNWFSCAAVQKQFALGACIWCESSLRGLLLLPCTGLFDVKCCLLYK